MNPAKLRTPLRCLLLASCMFNLSARISAQDDKAAILKDAIHILDSADQLRRDGKCTQAIAAYQRFLSLSDAKLKGISHDAVPQDLTRGHEALNIRWDIYNRIARCYEDLSLFDKAIASYRLSEYPRGKVEMLAECRDHDAIPLKLYLQANKIAVDTLEDGPEFADAQRAEAAFHKSISILKDLAARYPDAKIVPDAYFLMADDYHWGTWEDTVVHKEGLEQSIATYQEFIKRYPGSKVAGAARVMTGLDYDELGQPDAAVAQFQQAAKDYPAEDSSDCRDPLPYQKPHRPTGAIALYLAFDIRERQNQPKEALARCDELFKLYAQDSLPAQCYYRRALAEAKAGRDAEALRLARLLQSSFSSQTQLFEGTWREGYELPLSAAIAAIADVCADQNVKGNVQGLLMAPPH